MNSNEQPDGQHDAFADSLKQAVGLRDAPPALVHAAIALWAASAAPAAPLLAAARRLRAVLRFDSAQPAQGLLAVRSAAPGNAVPRHLLFSVEGRDIDLRVSPVQGGYTLAGQVLGPDEAGQVDVLAADAQTVVLSTQLNALGEFQSSALPAGRYTLLLRLVGDNLRHASPDDIVLPEIDVGGNA